MESLEARIAAIEHRQTRAVAPRISQIVLTAEGPDGERVPIEVCDLTQLGAGFVRLVSTHPVDGTHAE
jgi:hypothetical protein